MSDPGEKMQCGNKACETAVSKQVRAVPVAVQ